MSRFIIECAEQDLEFAWRALESAVGQLAKHDSFIVSYASDDGPDFYVKRNKRSISIRSTKRCK